MRAVVYERFGSVDVLEVRDLPKPKPKDHEVLIRIHAATVAAEDPGMRASRGLNGIRKPKHPILGFYLAGEVEEVGKEVTRFQVGDQVYGNTGLRLLGTYVEYKCMPESAAIVKKPDHITYAEAASIPNGALTSLPFLRDLGKIKRGQKLLILGASGAVGTAAVQLAVSFGAEVTGVCSTSNIDLVKRLGADNVIDYSTQDFTETKHRYDIIFDAVGKSSYGRCKNLLTEKGVYLTTIPTASNILRRKKSKFSATGLRADRKKVQDLHFVNTLIESQVYQPVIDRYYALEQIKEAHSYVEKGRKKGNVIITL
ncbi:NAD(P)-dependent alcohol dehydrogenase [Halobacillus litoralis]|uniref:NAD(P)-dependent alcohol dehydrogenase n=1 Tax=Halobacillus litoralis TaxID=45668 RepID=UPI001CD67612|nr:NAD(P)-dependent alcohol dehydrogenase [Halobacillus litoralis]MCA0970676.1 NAD(P)-dependent alcohol dehydrogenase [Halobacillus litoralis]